MEHMASVLGVYQNLRVFDWVFSETVRLSEHSRVVESVPCRSVEEIPGQQRASLNPKDTRYSSMTSSTAQDSVIECQLCLPVRTV